MGVDHNPWTVGVFRQAPAGLRETCLRVAYLPSWRLSRIVNRRKGASLFSRVAGWRLDTPDRFRALCDLFGFQGAADAPLFPCRAPRGLTARGTPPASGSALKVD